MQIDDFDFVVPKSLIAFSPANPRDSSRLFFVDKNSGEKKHLTFRNLPEILKPGDCLVLNRTKVLPARLFGVDVKRRKIEILLTEQRERSPLSWFAMARPGKCDEMDIEFEGPVRAKMRRDKLHGILYQVDFEHISEDQFFPWLYRVGTVPLPPYIKRDAVETDREAYQTVFAKDLGSVAAPTAGLHFTKELLSVCEASGVRLAEITLHVGLGTFAPIRVQNLDDHEMHEEAYSISPETYECLQKTKSQGGRIIAVGTTSLRALESIPQMGLSGRTKLFIRPGFSFSWADALITNFHVPKSSLFVLVSAFLGLETARTCYREAVELKYRFHSYGDAMFIVGSERS
jgi:S-adenosylmethionine:tRNA ribosyltransferase-isomerase